MIILGIDPGSARCGYGVVEKNGSRITYVACGCIETPKNLSEAKRLLMLDTELSRIIEQYRPHEAAVETIFLFKNSKTVIEVAQARGVILRCLANSGIRAYAYTPLQVKQAVSSYGRAEKQQVLSMVMKLLHLTDPPKPDDAADALAVALCHAAIPEALKNI